MPKIIYKPPVSQQGKDFGTREKSQRAKKRVKKFGTDKIVKKKKANLKQRNWSLKDKEVLMKKLQEHGTGDVKLLLDPQIKKTEKQINELVAFHKKSNKMLQVMRPEAKHHNDKIWISKEIDEPIEMWISLAESSQKPQIKGPQAVMDCQHILSDVLSVIINEEKHPLPEEADGVDYADIYRFIDELLKGDLPKRPNEASCAKIVEMLNQVREAVNASESSTSDERTFLERYSLRDLGNLNAPFVNKCTDSQIEILSTLPKINPLNIAPAFFSKPFLPKESKSLSNTTDKEGQDQQQ